MSHTGCQLPSDCVGDTIMYYRVTISNNRKKAIFFLYVIIVAPKTVCYELMILPEFIFAFIFPFNATFPIFFSRLLLGHVHGILTPHITYILDYRSYNSYPQLFIHSEPNLLLT